MDTVSGREYQDITVVKCSQSAGTEIINNAVGYFIDQEPSSMLVIQPNIEPMAEAWSKERLSPMIRDCPRLKNKVKDPKARDSGNTVKLKMFAGGFVAITGANSPAGLASRPIRVVLADELDRWTQSAGTEGDPLALSGARQITYRHRKKTLKVSSPGNQGESRMEKEWELSDQRHFEVACPHCQEYQPLEWRDTGSKANISMGRGEFRLQWDKDEDGNHKPETAHYVCRACAGVIEETHKPAMLSGGKWVKYNPKSRKAGFHISGLISPWVRWSDLASEWLSVKDDPEQRKTFINTKLGLLYISDGEEATPDELEKRRQSYKAEVPVGVGVLTAGIDVQGDRLEIDIRGWGEKEESWPIYHEKIYGDPEAEDVWQKADALLVKPWRHECGLTLRVRACMVDSGYKSDCVYQFVKTRQLRGVFASKGVPGAKAPLSRASRANRDGVKVFTINPNAFKDVLFSRLKRKLPGPGFMHMGDAQQTGMDDEYLRQYGAERKVVETKNGKTSVRYIQIKGRRNEAIDLYVLCLTALRSMGRSTVEHLGKYAKTLSDKVPDPDSGDELPNDPEEMPVNTSDVPVNTSRTSKAPRGRRSSGWVNSWRK